jgi:uncharacterized membrane protein YdjX (TVP38/TMEM64 family)
MPRQALRGSGPALRTLRRGVGASQLLPAARGTLAVVLLFALALWVTRRHAAAIEGLLAAHATTGVLVFVATSAVAVLLPVLTNLPLVPLAELAWGPWCTAGLLLLGWTLGAVAAFALGRHAQPHILRLFPSVARHADIDRLIHPQHRLWSLVLLRATFPVDVLSCALGAFSRSTTPAEQAWSTVIGAAPFALLFAWLPAMPASMQALVVVGSTLAFAVYAARIMQRPSQG